MSQVNGQTTGQRPFEAASVRSPRTAHPDGLLACASGSLGTAGDRYWRSLEELADTAEFRAWVAREFPDGASEMLGGATRRHFLKIMGASFAMAGLAGCRWPEEKIVPYARRPEGRNPGQPVQYATAMELAGAATGLLVTSYDGRPIKVEGNPLHPHSLGATNAIQQASILELYDPDRSRTVMRRDGAQRTAATWDDFVAFAEPHFAELRQRGGEGLCVLSELSSSPSLADMRERFLRAFPKAHWCEHEPIGRDNEIAGAVMAFRKPCRTHYRLDRAKVIVCLDADLLMTHPAAIRYARDFAEGRKADDPQAEMSRLYAIESTYSVTGAAADCRYAVRSVDVGAALAQLVAELKAGGLAIPGIGDGPRPKADFDWIGEIATDLLAHKGDGVLAVGPRQPPVVHAVAHAVNAALGAVGRTVTYTIEPAAAASQETFGVAARDLGAGRVNTLLVLGGNPVYDGAAELGPVEAMARVPTSIHLGLYDDETGHACTWHVPRAHYLESWSDARAYDGAVSVVQPLIEPLYGGKTPIEMLAVLTGEGPSTGHEIVRRTFAEHFGRGGGDAAWRKALHDGIVADSAWAPLRMPVPFAPPVTLSLGQIGGGSSAPGEGFEVVLVPDHRVYDGRFANNAWLQELPDPLTRLTWDNAAILSPGDAQTLGVTNGDVIRVSCRAAGTERTCEIAAFVLPGQAAGSITLPLGHGRTRCGRVGTGVGVDTYVLRGAGEILPGCSVRTTGRRYPLAMMQDQHTIDKVGIAERQRRAGRAGEVGEVVREATLTHYRADPEFARHAVHVPELKQLWQEPVAYDRHRWAMAVDLNRCIGCGACVVACQAENNIPVVGKEQVIKGRAMHWIRIDRYFRGDPAAPSVIHEPVACVHCENAPCEQVCPVAATVHDDNGLNVMVYNRCIGTRYCSNNCPYKVRRFNFFNWHKDLPETEKMAFNPEVTVRSRGVMEKCTYCVQRIEAALIRAKNERRPVRDGEIVPACAQCCPTQAIVFGDLNDAASRVRKRHEHPRAFGMLAELNVRPRTWHLARVRNPGGDERPTGGGTESQADTHSTLQ